MGYEAIEDWFEGVVFELPTHALLDLLGECLADPGGEGATLR